MILPNFLINCMKLTKFWTVGKGMCQGAPLDLPLDTERVHRVVEEGMGGVQRDIWKHVKVWRIMEEHRGSYGGGHGGI